ncbi:MAG TPA: transglutaminase family protein [Burkholderiales bacterium]|nr:transglutaminase family protein [Burkholderiales bacterium]
MQFADAILDVGAAHVSPYSEAQWRAIDGLARRVDADLKSLGVKLTQGGEPTFVAAAGGEAPEWNHSAMGPDKRRFAGRLLRRLHARFAPAGLMHFGQGKWYPGEPLPRWALGLIWRKDATALWRDPQLIANEEAGTSHGMEDARRLIGALAERLGIAANLIVPAYEDPWPALDSESGLPEGVDPLRSDLGNADERARLARLLRQGLASVAGYVLPLRTEPRADARGPTAWRSSRWPLRRERLYLMPGESPIGYRLPLDTLPETEPARIALCVEARGGLLHVFVPPLDTLDDYLALIAAVEMSARELGLPVLPEGYEPPPDDTLITLRITPDPGVIEVNVHPAADWNELSTITAAVYEEARGLGLAAEKFMRDGRRTGTGGGSHITLGGAAPAESPLLRRPDLLASLIAYWQNHPALSYLFSGQYIGPTCQAPRVDEAREDSLYELEIAFQQLARLQQSGAPAPERIDRLLRNLLVDITGNTHRAEFCIDKLYSPDGPAGRLGLLELRAFEMAPHSRMALVQFLLVRALVAQFWQTPYRGRLIRWGTALHDRYMLPHYLAADLREVVSGLNAAGRAFDFEWLEPFFEFRFPLCGTVACGPVTLELRHALEPWPVLGEAAAVSGTSRAVDASLDRVQIRVSGMDGAHHAVLCNGRRVPLQPTGTAGEYVAGVRYRARLFPSVLHPTIGVHAPLAVDVVDTRIQRALGGCTYHAMGPGGKEYERPPAGESEAAARRKTRFITRGPDGRTLAIPPESPNPFAPCTLDLRLSPESPS